MNNTLFGFDPKDTWLHKLGGATKLLSFIGLSLIAMASYDTRFIILIMLMTLVLFWQAKISWCQISVVVKIIFAFSLLNLIAVYIFSPEYGVQIYGTRHVILGENNYFTLTQEQLFYELNLALKYVVTVPLALIFLITTNPSEFAASLNQLGVPYKISYAVALTLRYIPDVQANYLQISLAQQARGYELSKKANLIKRLKGISKILMPLIFSSLEKIDTISQAMELRRFGNLKKRSWYMGHKLKWQDYLTLLVVFIIVLCGVILFKINNGRFYNIFK